MRGFAKVGVVVLFTLMPLSAICALPVVWYVLFTLPEERDGWRSAPTRRTAR